MPQLQGPRAKNPTTSASGDSNRPSIMDTDDTHVADCLVWRDRRWPKDGLPVPSGRVRRWYCENYNRCDENYFRQWFCRQNHAKSGDPKSKPCKRWHCPQEPCDSHKCSYNHCQSDDCRRDRFEALNSGCREPNCRKCRGLDPKTERHIGYVRRPELGRAKDRGISSEPPKYRPRPNDGSAAEAISGWPNLKEPTTHKRHGQLEPLGVGRLATGKSGSGSGDEMEPSRQNRDQQHMHRHTMINGPREDARDLWQMPRFVNNAKPKISSIRDPDDPAFPNNGRHEKPPLWSPYAQPTDQNNNNRQPQQQQPQQETVPFANYGNGYSVNGNMDSMPTRQVAFQSNQYDSLPQQRYNNAYNSATEGSQYYGQPQQQQNHMQQYSYAE